MKIICSRTQPKTFLALQVFQQTCFCVVSERIFALHHFLTPKNCILEALWKQMSIHHLKKNCFLDAGNFCLVGSGMGRRLNKFLKAVRCLGLAKCFTVFYFNWNFWKLNHFYHFDTSIYDIKTLKFSRQFGFQG